MKKKLFDWVGFTAVLGLIVALVYAVLGSVAPRSDMTAEALFFLSEHAKEAIGTFIVAFAFAALARLAWKKRNLHL